MGLKNKIDWNWINWTLRGWGLAVRYPRDKELRRQNHTTPNHHVRRLKHHTQKTKYDKKPGSVHFSYLDGGSFISYPKKKYRRGD